MDSQPPQQNANIALVSDLPGTLDVAPHKNAPTVNISYVLAERNKRTRALWAETPVAQKARNYLNSFCGLSDATIRQYNIGLVCCRPNGAAQTAQQALCIPVPDNKGPAFAPCLAAENPAAKQRGQYVLLAIPGIDAQSGEAQWKRGSTLTMYLTPETGSDLIVCSGTLEAICLAQMLGQCCGPRFSIIVSTHPSEYPPDWTTAAFWARWQRVYFAQTAGRQEPQAAFPGTQDMRCIQLANLAQRPVLRVQLPDTGEWTPFPDWLAYFRSGGTPQTALDLFDNAQVIAKALSITKTFSCIAPPRLDEFAEGEYGDVTYDVAYNYVGGYYYYPFSVLQFSIGVNGQRQITRQTRLLRNDGRILGWDRVPSSKGTSDVVAADDGTLLSRPPEVSDIATWSLDHILAYARAASTGGRNGRPLADILRDMRKLFEECIWLPFREQLELLTFIVPVTYVQELFSAVPYLLIQGPKGSGKSELAHLLSWVSSNSTIIGCGSHAFTAAQIDQARGLIVLDDRETLAANDLDTDLLELLKVGYKRATGNRGIIAQNRKIIRQHVYGVKAITCVSGVEEIVGTRMLRIRTAPYSKSRATTPIRRFQAADQETAHRLRQEMHMWTFQNVDAIRTAYDRLPQSGSRWDEITAPLRTFAAICGDADLESKLNDALDAQGHREAAEMSADGVLGKVVEDLVRRGLTHELSITHIRNELASKLSDSTIQAPELIDPGAMRASWITRTLKTQGWLKGGTAVRRARVRKKVLQRIWALEPARVTGIVQKLTDRPESLDALSFCKNCGDCEYRTVCEIKKHFEPRVATKPRH